MLKRVLAIVASAAALVAVIAAPPAAAGGGGTTVPLTCDGDVIVNASVGETLAFTFDPVKCDSDYWYLWNVNGTVDSNTNSGYLDYLGSTPGTDYWPNYDYGRDWYVYQDSPRGAVVVASLMGMTAEAPETPLAPGTVIAAYADYYGNSYVIRLASEPDSTPPPSWYQSYGRTSADAACEAGWTPSYAEWMNSGTGGWVCNREQFWDRNTGDWSYRSHATRE